MYSGRCEFSVVIMVSGSVSGVNYDIEAVKLDHHARHAWPAGPAGVVQAGQDGGRRQSISSEESLSDCEELGGMSSGGLVDANGHSETK